jgi:iron complex outermembrane receptor protein
MTSRKSQLHPFRHKILSCSVIAACATISMLAQAQTTVPAPAPATAQDAADSNVVVITAGKRKQNQNDVAGTVTALSGSTLEALGAESAEEVFKQDAGVQFNKGNADGALYTIRGIGTNTTSDNVIFGQAPTGLYINDIPFTDPYVYISTPDVAAFDLERVEVLKGPQGVLYGSASLGGAVRYMLAKPDMSQEQFTVMGGLSEVPGGGSGFTMNGMANIPLSTDVAALRFVYTARKDPGYVDNLGTGRDNINDNKPESGRVILELKPMPSLDITAMYLKQQSSQDGGSSVSPNPDELTVNTPTDAHVDSSFSLGSLEVNYDTSGLRFTSLSGYQTKTRNEVSDFSYQLVPDFTLYNNVGEGPYPNVTRSIDLDQRHSDSFSQEFRVAPTDPGNFNWLVGAFHQDSRFYRSQVITLPGADDPVNLPDDVYFNTVRYGTARENSLFFDADYKLTPQWTIAAGARYFTTDVDFERSNYGAPFAPFTSSDNGTTPKFSTRYQFTPMLSGYLLASRGYRFGGINTVGDALYKPDSLWNYEAGLRMQPSHDLSVTLSAFTMDWKNIQVSSSDAQGFVIISNVAAAKSNGLEAAASWHPMSNLRLNGSFAYTDAEIKAAFLSADGINVASDTPLPGVAKVQTTMDATYLFPGLFDSSGSFSAVYQHVGERKAQIDADLELPGYQTVDLRLKFSWTKWELTGYVQNVANSRGQSSADVNYSTYEHPGEVNYTEWYPIRPRTIGMTLRYDY